MTLLRKPVEKRNIIKLIKTTKIYQILQQNMHSQWNRKDDRGMKRAAEDKERMKEKAEGVENINQVLMWKATEKRFLYLWYPHTAPEDNHIRQLNKMDFSQDTEILPYVKGLALLDQDD